MFVKVRLVSIPPFPFPSPPIYVYRRSDFSTVSPVGVLRGPRLHTATIREGSGLRNITYSVSGKYAIVNEDTVWGTVEEVEAQRFPGGGVATDQLTGSNRSRTRRAFSVTPSGTPNRAWPGGKIPYKFDSDYIAANLAVDFQAAIDDWLAVAPYLSFVHLGANNDTEVENALNVIWTGCSGCFSMVGWEEGWGTILGLQFTGGCPVGPGALCGATAWAITHEIGHALGTAPCMIPLSLADSLKDCSMNINDLTVQNI